ncbi:hypothetical protein [Streptomyces sp. Amel2xC10]|uniref:hypothetical protein n=1 Tax=Streptomyces sp. Amel2xC10 TaxID=1305826 RepID=UPI000A08AA95|nr:hypothetical protein [Streptomyces sp. Amel2xC10]SMF85861.1 hypothetical protein SAMN02745830_07066 [Streptomyces sp. Amel2xC10]
MSSAFLLSSNSRGGGDDCGGESTADNDAERCHIDRDDYAIVLVNKARTVHVPAAWLAVLS